MREILFLIGDGRVRAFGPEAGSSAACPLRYEGKEDMPCADATDVAAFVEYALDNYGGADLRRVSFVCLESAALAICAQALAHVPKSPPAGLFNFAYLLPSFWRKLKLSGGAIVFAGKVWIMSKDPVTRADVEGAYSLRLLDMARLFFSPEPLGQATEINGETPVAPPGELARFVWGSQVKPKIAEEKNGRG